MKSIAVRTLVTALAAMCPVLAVAPYVQAQPVLRTKDSFSGRDRSPFPSSWRFGARPHGAFQAAASRETLPTLAWPGVFLAGPGTGQPKVSPIANDDTAYVYDMFGVTVFPLENDLDPEGGELRIIEIVLPPSAGSADIDPDGRTIYYSPYAPLTATDTLLYRVEDSAGASAVAQISFIPRPVQLSPYQERVDIGNIAQGSLVSAWGRIHGVPPGMTGTVTFVPVDGTEIASALAGTSHDPAQAVSDPAAFGALDWTPAGFEATDPIGVAIILFRPLAQFGQVSVARAVLETTISTGPISTSFYVIGESADPAVMPARAVDDAATTPIDTTVDVYVIANDLDPNGGGIRVWQPWKCPNLIEHVYGGVPCGSIHGTLLVPLDPVTNKVGEILRFTPDAGFTGQASTYYGMGDVVTDWDSLFYYARVTFDVGGTPSYALTIAPVPTAGTVSGNGLACGNGGTTCQVSFGSATTATLTATPASGYVFTSWGGSCAGSDATTTVLVDAVRTCSATFTAAGGPVNGPPYTMTITPPTGGKVQGAGLNCGGSATLCSVTMPASMTLGLSAIPASGYVFSHWTGDCSGTDPGIFVTLAGPRTCSAVFTPTGGGGTPSYALTIAPVPTGGTVTGGGLTCGNGGATCSVTVTGGTLMSLTATPASGYVFTSWGGACAGPNPSTSVTVDAAKTCSATFTASGGPVNGPPYTMTITPPTGGSVQGAGLNCGGGATACSVTMPAAMTLGMGATPSAGYTFSHWTGDCSGTNPSLWVSLSGPRACSAVFTPTGGGGTPSYALTITPVPTGGTVTGGGLTCGTGGAACSATVASGTTVTLTATAASGYAFTSWGGACAGPNPSTSVTMDAAKTCSATFTASGGPVNGPPYTMTITPPAGGSVQGAGLNCGGGATQCSVTMPASMTLGLSAIPASGYVFSSWTGDCSGTTPGLNVALAGPRTCSAVFTPTGGPVNGPPYTMTIFPIPTGGTVLGGGLNCSTSTPDKCGPVTVLGSTTLGMSAYPSSGYKFSYWTGDCAAGGTDPTLVIVLSGPRTCSAVFTPTSGPVNGPPYTMTITPPTGGSVQGAGLNCGGGATQCSVTMPASMTLGLSAIPASGYVFSAWSGDCSGTTPGLFVTLAGPRSCGATFTPK